MLKISRCVFFLALVNICLIPGCDSGTGSTTNFPVVVFSDVHFDPFYDPSLFTALVSADVSKWESIFQTSSITAPSVWGKDTNYPLLELALSSIRQNLGRSPLIIFTGDILVHRFSETFYALYGSQDVAAMEAFADKTVDFFTEQVRSSVGNIPIMFAVGNNDSYEDLGPDSTFLSNTAEFFYTEFLDGTSDHQTFLDTFTSGGYYSAEPSGTKLMVIGLNTIPFSPSPLIGDTHGAVAAELSWLDARLASAKAAGEKVWLLMHIPPGADTYSTAAGMDNNGHISSVTMMWKPDYQASFLHILSNYPGIITLILAGHTHMDEYRILSSSDVVEVTPSISPRSGNNPAFKVFSFSGDTFKPTDYSSLNYDLTTMPAQFNNYYTFSAAYSEYGLLNSSLGELFPSLATNAEKQALYRGYYYSGHNTSSLITDANWPVCWSGIGIMDEQGIIDAVNAY
jgi:sphingomyelin phosphodiesterase acid-like 3